MPVYPPITPSIAVVELILPQWLQPLGAEYQARNHVYRVLQPSATLAEAWLRRQGQGAWIAKVLPMVREHHKLSPYRNGARFEAFRRAGWLDVSWACCNRCACRLCQAGPCRFPHCQVSPQTGAIGAEALADAPVNPLPMLKL